MARITPALLSATVACVAASAAAGSERAPGLPAGQDGTYRERMLSWRAPDAPRGGGSLLPPVDMGQPSSGFGLRRDPINGSARRHAGVDLPGQAGAPVRAAADGVVTRAARVGGYGNLVGIDHGDGMETRYAHLAQIDVVPGMTIRRGDVLGLVGSTGRSTGNHLHFEVRVDGRAADPLDRLSGDGVRSAAPARVVEPRWGGWSAQGGLPQSILK